MLPMRWDPMRELSTFQRELDDLFRRMAGVTQEQRKEGAMTIAPAINTYTKDGVFHLEAELPGVDTDKLDVRIDGHNLVLHGERKEAREVKEADYLLRESSFSNFERTLALPDGVDCDNIHASYKDGILDISGPLIGVEAGGRKIAIEGLKSARKSKEVH